jgi:hypothetical protein
MKLKSGTGHIFIYTKMVLMKPSVIGQTITLYNVD